MVVVVAMKLGFVAVTVVLTVDRMHSEQKILARALTTGLRKACKTALLLLHTTVTRFDRPLPNRPSLHGETRRPFQESKP